MVMPRLFPRPMDKSSKERDIEKAALPEIESKKPLWKKIAEKKTGAFALLAILFIIAGIVFLTLLFAACHVLPNFISKHCQDNGMGNAAIGKRLMKRATEMVGLIRRNVGEALTDNYRLHEKKSPIPLPIPIPASVSVTSPDSASSSASAVGGDVGNMVLPTGIRVVGGLVKRLTAGGIGMRGVRVAVDR